MVAVVQWVVATAATIGMLSAVVLGEATGGLRVGGVGSAASQARQALVFRVEGSGSDPEYRRACEVVRWLEDLYGEQRYRLHQVDVNAEPASRNRRRRWLQPHYRLFGKRSQTYAESEANYPPVVCSIEPMPNVRAGNGGAVLAAEDTTAAKDAAGVKDATVEKDTTIENDTAVRIGGVEDLLEFVRDSLLAGPRPFSLAFHEQGLRLKHRARDEGFADPSRTNASPESTKPKYLREDGGPNSIVSKSGSFEYDLIVIGGGSGGLACAKEAARFGRRVACLDYVKPSPRGSKWGLGGTCVNVGCIPKKLMHQAALHGGLIEDAKLFGWQTGFRQPSPALEGEGERTGRRGAHDWEIVVTGVQNYIKGLSFKYRTDLRSRGVDYLNALGRLEDPHTVIATDNKGNERVLTCDKVVVAVGGRPKELACEGGELAITSDDLFSLKKPPGKTLVVGASYVALECAGFLTGLGLDITVMVRSVLLRGFDQGMAERIGSFMESEGTRFLRPAIPHRISETDEGRLLVRWSKSEDGTTWLEEEFDTVLAATGRKADVAGLGLEKLGAKLGTDGKIICCNEETNVAGVFGLGDVVEGVPELTPSAIQAGRLLAKRLFGGSAEAMDYSNVCTTVFTPLEYACVGLSEEDAVQKLGEDNVEVYHSAFTPLEWQLIPERPQNACYVKAVCDTADRERVVGLHLLAPNAGEVMQGFGLGVRLGMTYDDLRQLVGIHPTVAEELTLLQVTKRSGEPIEKSGC